MPTVHVLADDPLRRATLIRRSGSPHTDNPSAATVVVSQGATVDEALQRCQRDRRFAGARLVLVADEVEATSVYRATKAGVAAILRHADLDRLAETVRTAATTTGTMPGEEVGKLLDALPRAVEEPEHLSDREVHVLRLVADGYGNAAIALHLNCSPHTVKNTIYDLMTRLRLRNRTHAAAFAVRAGVA